MKPLEMKKNTLQSSRKLYKKNFLKKQSEKYGRLSINDEHNWQITPSWILNCLTVCNVCNVFVISMKLEEKKTNSYIQKKGNMIFCAKLTYIEFFFGINKKRKMKLYD